MNKMGKSPGQWLFGLIILVIGIIFLLENLLGISIWGRIWLFWPIFILLWGLMEILQKKSIFFGLILLTMGALFLLKNLELLQLPDLIWKYWPVIIIALGLDQLMGGHESTIIKTSHAGGKTNKKMLVQDDEII